MLVMAEGDLLIGGMTLRRLPCEIQEELHTDASPDWRLRGKLVIDASDEPMLQVGRRYRLQLKDGRAGQVVLSRLAAEDNAHCVAEFQPPY